MTPLHEDDALLAFDKPAGLLAVPGRVEHDCLAERVRARWGDAMVVHRLDMATSGLMLFARGAAAQRVLAGHFAQRRVHKRYVAIVHGAPDDDAGAIALPLAADWPNRPRQAVDPVHGKAALTRWQVLGRDASGRSARLALEPVTGRTHQLRVHLQAIGHAIVGDTLYGGPPAGRLMLHASHVSLPHPRTGRTVVVDCLPPF